MIKEREPVLERISVLFQVIVTIICFYLVLKLFGDLPISFGKADKEYLVIGFIIVPLWFLLLDLFEAGAMSRIQNYSHIIKKYAFVNLLGILILYLLVKLFDYERAFTASVLFKFGMFNFIILTLSKIISRTVVRYFRRNGYNTRMILTIADETSIPFIDQIIENSDWGYRIWGIFSDSPEIILKYGEKYPVYSENENFAKIIEKKNISEVYYCKKDFETSIIRNMVDDCREIGVSFHIHNNVLSFSGLQPKLFFLNHQFFLSFRNTPENYFALKIKGAIDFFLSAFILIFISPFLLIIGLLIKLEDGGPVLFKQIRVGRYGRQFKCLKFRTMIVNAEEHKTKLMALNEQDGPVFKIKNDPRITKIGRFLRKASLDELPQFINVLFGDMSIVGPRPPIPSEVKQYKRSLYRRLSINPGITCIWQVSGRNNVSFDKWMEMDMQYIDNWSLKLDLLIMLKTFRVVFMGNGQ